MPAQAAPVGAEDATTTVGLAERENPLSANTLIGALFEPAQAVPGDVIADEAAAPAPPSGGRLFKIRGADSDGQRSSANVLIRRRYAWRGYDASALPPAQMSHRITLTATDHNMTIGTITVGLDGNAELHAEETFGEEIGALRAAGRSICEFTKLAVDTDSASKRVLASLFHVAYLLAHRIRGCDTLVIEVNPRHVAYYRRLLGCRVLGAERDNRRVNAPAVLLSLDLHHAREQIALLGGHSDAAAGNQRTLYPFFFSAAEERGIIARLQREPWW